jgi:hypothetical protein
MWKTGIVIAEYIRCLAPKGTGALMAIAALMRESAKLRSMGPILCPAMASVVQAPKE